MNGILQEKTQPRMESRFARILCHSRNNLGKKVGIINAQFFLTEGKATFKGVQNRSDFSPKMSSLFLNF